MDIIAPLLCFVSFCAFLYIFVRIRNKPGNDHEQGQG